MTPVRMELTRRPRSTVLSLAGTLDLRSHAEVRGGLLKASAEAPEGLIADVSELEFADDAQLSVFALVAMRVGNWPGVPFALVTRLPRQQAVLNRSPVAHYARVHSDPAQAERAFGTPVRLRAVREFPRSETAGELARGFTGEVFRSWAIPEKTGSAQTIVTELVANALQHTCSVPEVRLDVRRGVCSVAVADGDPRRAELREQRNPMDPGLGLKIVAQLACVWGSCSAWSGGKVVWATLRVPRSGTAS
ncbi:ATP-binding protein [Amycolatopsis sp. NPDC051903]|uniref:ATP-binding protein n=1 Tax=Amycolatopsis sp. NPDC051903 TaxID=3363936 RepID=UPI0037B1BC5D